MDGVAFRRDLIDPKHLKALSRRSDLRGLLQLASHLGAITTAVILLAMSWGGWWVIPAFMLLGLVLNYTYAIQHEVSHWTAFKSRWLNDAVGRMVGFLQLYPRDYDRWLHFTHHRFTQDLDRDPEIKGSPAFILGEFLYDLSGLGYWIRRFRTLVRVALGDTSFEDYLTPAQRGSVVRETRAHLAVYAGLAVLSLALQSWLLVIYWIAPLILMKWSHQPQNLIEHSGLTHAPDTLINTRTIKTNPVLRWLLWNMPYHTVHHTFPGVPFFRLPELHRAVVAKLGHQPPSASYPGFIGQMIRTLPRARARLQPAR